MLERRRVMETQNSGWGVAWWPGWWSGGESKRERRKERKWEGWRRGSGKDFGWAGGVGVPHVWCPDSANLHMSVFVLREKTRPNRPVDRYRLVLDDFLDPNSTVRTDADVLPEMP